MERERNAFTCRASLTIVVFLLMLLPPAASSIAWTSDPDSPEPLFQDVPYKMFVTSQYAAKGFTLVAPYNGNKIFLVDDEGTTLHTWTSARQTMGTVLMLEDGTLIRGRSGASGQPSGIHQLDWDGTVLWDYQPPADFKWHHDIAPLPNGHFLVTAVATYTYDQAVGMGRDPGNTDPVLSVDRIVEIEPNGANGGDVVWMWNPLDHLVQDFNSSKPNHGVVEDHPELIDINFPPSNSLSDWLHVNALAYNAELDQVMITALHFSEIWVVDHNTTTAEAAGHSGGGHGKGGDLLYRWGNPQTYRAGDAGDQILYGGHNGHWIGPGLPGEGNIIIFNNGINSYLTRPEGRYSTIEELVPPINATGDYDLAPGSAYGPSDPTWRYTASPPSSFFSTAMGGVERLPDGDTLVCGGSSGYNFEVDTGDKVVWEYRCTGPFRMSRYYPPALDMDQDLNATEDVPLRVDISPYISDPDTDHEDLMVGVDSPFASVSGYELLLQYPDGITTDVINLTLSDGVFMVGRDVRVNITPVDDPPVLAPIPDIEATEDVPHILDLRSFILDPDTDIGLMNITEDSSYVTVQGSTLRLLYPNGVLDDRFNLSVSDGELGDSTEILVNVNPVNDPPTVDRVPDQQGVEDVPWTVDLSGYIRDIDSPIQDVTVKSDSPYTGVAGLNLSLLYPEGVTRDMVFLTISDGRSGTVIDFNVTIEPVNDPPVIGVIPPLALTEDVPFFLDLGPAISDIDTPMEELVLRVGSPFIEVGGLVLSLLYPDGILHDEVVIELWDGDLHVNTTLVVDVEPVNDPPVIGAISPVTIKEDVPFSLDIGPAISDIDTPAGELVLRVDSPYIGVVGHNLSLLYPDGVLHDEVTVNVWDGALNASTTLVVTVEPVNDSPWWGVLPSIAAVEDVEGEFYLAPYMNDIDTPFGQLAVEVVSSYGSMDGNSFKFVYPNGVPFETVTFTLTDGEFRVVIQSNVIVTPVNDAPELSGAHVEAPGQGAGTTFNFTVVFKDIDMGADAPVVEVVIDGTSYRCARDALDARPYGEGATFFLAMDLGPGTHVFHFTADDGDGGTATTEDLPVVVAERPEGTELPMALISLLIIIGAVAVVAVLLLMRRRASGPPA